MGDDIEALQRRSLMAQAVAQDLAAWIEGGRMREGETVEIRNERYTMKYAEEDGPDFAV